MRSGVDGGDVVAGGGRYDWSINFVSITYHDADVCSIILPYSD